MLGLTARHGAVMDRFAELRASTWPLDLKKAYLVMALVDFFMPDAQPADLALVLALFPPSRLKLYGEILRGRITAAVAGLAAAGMKTASIERWLEGEIQRRALDFEAAHVIQWFYDCSSERVPVPRRMLEAFRLSRPTTPLTKVEAKARAAHALDAAVVLKAGPLSRASDLPLL